MRENKWEKRAEKWGKRAEQINKAGNSMQYVGKILIFLFTIPIILTFMFGFKGLIAGIVIGAIGVGKTQDKAKHEKREQLKEDYIKSQMKDDES